MVGLAGDAGGRRSAASGAVSGTRCTCMVRNRESALHTENTSCPHTSRPGSAQNGCTSSCTQTYTPAQEKISTVYTPTRDASCLTCHGRHSISLCARNVSHECQYLPLVAPHAHSTAHTLRSCATTSPAHAGHLKFNMYICVYVLPRTLKEPPLQRVCLSDLWSEEFRDRIEGSKVNRSMLSVPSLCSMRTKRHCIQMCHTEFSHWIITSVMTTICYIRM